MKHEDILTLIGILFIFLGSLGVYNAFVEERPYMVFWFCYSGLLLLGIGVLTRNSFLIGSQLSILTIPLLIWTFDFISFFFVPDSVFNIATYFFEPGHILAKIVTLHHLFTVPVSLWVLSKVRIERFDFWKVAFLQMLIVFSISLLMTPVEDNLNCVHRPCIPLSSPLPYWLTWLLVAFVMVFVTSFIFSRLPFIRARKHTK